MPSLDIVSKIDGQTLDNAINSAKREIINRYDFKGSNSTIELDKKSNQITILTEDDMRMDQLEKVIIGQFVKNKLDPNGLDWGIDRYASGNMIRKEVRVKQGIEREDAKKIVKSIKETKLKVQASIMEDQVRITGKKIDDLQAVMSHCRQADFGVPLQYINFK
ncbi:MAG: hypothetical protein ACI9N1_002234 [Flavobacteriales bacterium]|jgi:uncharacterized protein YajQ (UPF0234 family)